MPAHPTHRELCVNAKNNLATLDSTDHPETNKDDLVHQPFDVINALRQPRQAANDEARLNLSISQVGTTECEQKLGEQSFAKLRDRQS